MLGWVVCDPLSEGDRVIGRAGQFSYVFVAYFLTNWLSFCNL